VLATADGLHIASAGVDRDTSDRLAAMNASLFGVARAESEVISGGALPSLSAVVSVTIGDHHLAVMSFVLEPYGQLLFSVSASRVQLATVIVHARSTAYELISKLGIAGARL
jgi:predicted regulator of Ras-like GTPase activity (Roadblock/LC7/MglB family)